MTPQDHTAPDAITGCAITDKPTSDMPLPPRLLAVLETQPAFVTRRLGAALVRQHIAGGIGDRNLEDRRRWPLPTKFVGRCAMVSTADLFAMAWRRMETAPPCPPFPAGPRTSRQPTADAEPIAA
jgi:hypothetical protein